MGATPGGSVVVVVVVVGGRVVVVVVVGSGLGELKFPATGSQCVVTPCAVSIQPPSARGVARSDALVPPVPPAARKGSRIGDSEPVSPEHIQSPPDEPHVHASVPGFEFRLPEQTQMPPE